MSDSRAFLGDAARRLANAGVDNPRLDARVLWEHAQSLSFAPAGGEGRGEGVANSEPRSPPHPSPLPQWGRGNAVFEDLIARRCCREPLAYITGRKEFWSLDFEVGPGVLVPRPETETIIEQAIALLPDRSAPLQVLDLGTGSGCLLVAFLKEFPNSRGLGIDTSEKARAYAVANVNRHGLADRAEIRPGNWGEDIEGRWDVILSNPPYIRSADVHGLAPEVHFEPTEALDGGPDGLESIRLLAAAMARLLGGIGLTEIGAGQADAAATAASDAGLVVMRMVADLAGIPRVLVTRPPG